MTTYDTQPLIPWQEAVTVTSVRTAGNVAVTLNTAGANEVTQKEAARSNGVYVAGDLTVEFDPAAVGFDSKPRDLVTWSGRDYVVLSVGGDPNWLKFVTLHCRSPQIAYDLRDSVTITRPNASPGSGALRNPGAYTTVANAVDGRLQIDRRETETDTAGRLTTRTRATLYLANQVDVLAGDRVAVGGVIYEVAGQADIDALGLLTSVPVTRIG